MACPVCPTASWLGGWIGGYFGLKPAESCENRFFSAAVTATLTSITVIGLKALFNVSLCIEGKFNVSNIIRVGSQALVIGVIYSIGVNYILNRYVFSSRSQNEQKIDRSPSKTPSSSSSCCCKDQLDE